MKLVADLHIYVLLVGMLSVQQKTPRLRKRKGLEILGVMIMAPKCRGPHEYYLQPICSTGLWKELDL